jgi:hypothetical protein
MSSTRTSRDIAEQAEPTFDALADRGATRDAETLVLAPGSPSPTPCESELQAKVATTLTDLRIASTQEHRDATAARQMNQRVLTAAQEEEPVAIPDEVPLRKVSHRIYVLVGFLAAAETAALTDPFGTLLNVSEQSIERYLVPAVLSMLGVLLAHVSASFSARRRRAIAPQDQDDARRLAIAFAAALVVIGVAATLARTYTATLDASLAGGEALDPAGLGTFVLLQLGFGAGSLGAATYYFRKVTDAEAERLRTYLSGLEAQNRVLDAQLEQAPEVAAAQRDLVIDAFAGAVRRYRTWLAERHPSVAAQVAWTARTARELDDGLIERLLAGAPSPAAGPAGSSEVPPVNGAPVGDPPPDPRGAPDPTRPVDDPTLVDDPTVVDGDDPTVVDPCPADAPTIDLTVPLDPDPTEPMAEPTVRPPSGGRWSPTPTPGFDADRDGDDADLFDAILTPRGRG